MVMDDWLSVKKKFTICKNVAKISVADPGCLSRIRDPDLYPSRIQKQQQKRGWRKICCHTFFVAQISQNLILFYFWNAEEKNLGQFSKNYRTFYQKICY